MPVISRPTDPTPARATSGSRRRRAAGAIALLAALLALVGASCQQLNPDNRAAAVPAVTNGSLPMSYLASPGGGCAVYDEALASLKAMIAQAAKDGVKLKPVSCYRDYAGQVAARESWCNRGACQMAAVPGTSNHGWGKAIDFADQNGSLGFDSVGYTWLKTWAGYFGWIHPRTMEADGPVPEAWHWEWVGDGGKMYLGKYFGFGNAPLAEPRGLPFGNVDVIAAQAGAVQVAGWAIDPDQVASIPVHVYVDTSGVPITANQPRADVGAAYPLYAKAPHGFATTIPASPGRHQVCVYAINVSGTGYNRTLKCATVTVPAATPATARASSVGAPAATSSTPATSPTTSTTASTTTSTTTAVARPTPGATPTTTPTGSPSSSATTTTTVAQAGPPMTR